MNQFILGILFKNLNIKHWWSEFLKRYNSLSTAQQFVNDITMWLNHTEPPKIYWFPLFDKKKLFPALLEIRIGIHLKVNSRYYKDENEKVYFEVICKYHFQGNYARMGTVLYALVILGHSRKGIATTLLTDSISYYDFCLTWYDSSPGTTGSFKWWGPYLNFNVCMNFEIVLGSSLNREPFVDCIKECMCKVDKMLRFWLYFSFWIQ